VKDLSCIGSITIQPIVDPTVPAKLAVSDVARFDTSAAEVSNGDICTDSRQLLHIVFSVTDLATHDVALPASVVRDLQATSHRSIAECRNTESSLTIDSICNVNVLSSSGEILQVADDV
jgi:hypothetical protein